MMVTQNLIITNNNNNTFIDVYSYVYVNIDSINENAYMTAHESHSNFC